MARVPMRSSLRSRDSSSTSTGVDPREKIKNYCRKLIAFMFTQVGVGGLVVGYALLGATGFRVIETQEEYPHVLIVDNLRNACAFDLWEVAKKFNVFNESAYISVTEKILRDFQDNFTHLIKEGYNGRSVHEVWTFPAALMFSLSIMTMIGYGNMVPRTSWGKGATVMYAVVGIPLYILYFLNMGKVLAETFKWLYRWIHQCSGQRKSGARIIVPSTACLWVIFGYILIGAVMFAEWEKWDYLDSAYFCVTSLCKIGIGDFVPGANIIESSGGRQTKLVINFVYLLLGMGLIAMCYNLMREDVKVKALELKEEMTQVLDDLRLRMLTCCRGSPGPD